MQMNARADKKKLLSGLGETDDFECLDDIWTNVERRVSYKDFK